MNDAVSFVFSTGTGSPQTVDVNDVVADTFFEISSEKNGEGKYLVNTVQTGISSTMATAQPTLTGIYSIDGRLVRRQVTGLEGLNGLYLIGNKIVYVK